MSSGHCPDQERKGRSGSVSGVAQRCLKPEDFEYGTPVGFYPRRRYVVNIGCYDPGNGVRSFARADHEFAFAFRNRIRIRNVFIRSLQKVYTK